MKIISLAALALLFLTISQASAHDIHNQASDHTHRHHLDTHTISSHYGYNTPVHGRAYDGTAYNRYQSGHTHQVRPTANYRAPQTEVETYYTRNYPVKSQYTAYTTPNTTIHQPPYAYSSCAHNCEEPRRILVSRTVNNQKRTYRAPSEFEANCNLTPHAAVPRNADYARDYGYSDDSQNSLFDITKRETTTWPYQY